MGILDWFKQAASDKQAPKEAIVAVPAADKGAEVGGLNFMTAIEAHLRWKSRLENYIQGTSQEQLKTEVVSRDDQCPLGKWIYGQGGHLFGYSETFVEMQHYHADFHRIAGHILDTAQAGTKDEALRKLHHGDYVRTSEHVKMSLAKLFVLVSEGKAAIDAHAKWKIRLEEYIQGTGKEGLQAAVVSRDDQCTLGKWLHGPGKERFGHLPAFGEASACHVEFHRCAGEVVALVESGRKDDALRMVEDGEYARASDAVTVALVRLFKLEAQNV